MRFGLKPAHDITEPLFIMEKRDKDGKLDFSPPWSPYPGDRPGQFYWTEHEIAEWYFRNNEEGASATMDTIRKWYADQGFCYRRKTW